MKDAIVKDIFVVLFTEILISVGIPFQHISLLYNLTHSRPPSKQDLQQIVNWLQANDLQLVAL